MAKVTVSAWLLALSMCAAHADGQVIGTVAGTTWIFPTGGKALGASLGSLTGVAADAQGNVYAADDGNNVVIRVSPGGSLTVVAGNGTAGFSGDGGPAADASLNLPTGVALDSAGNLYIADILNNRIRKVSGGIITTVAGNGIQGFSGDRGPATGAALDLPHKVAIDLAGNLYIAEASRIRKVSGGTITTVAGNGIQGFSGDGGPATGASLMYPVGVAVDSAGNFTSPT